MKNDGFSVHNITDADGEVRNALVHYNEDEKCASITIDTYYSGTQMAGEAARLVNKLFKKCKKADLLLNGRSVIQLPIGYYA